MFVIRDKAKKKIFELQFFTIKYLNNKTKKVLDQTKRGTPRQHGSRTRGKINNVKILKIQIYTAGLDLNNFFFKSFILIVRLANFSFH